MSHDYPDVIDLSESNRMCIHLCQMVQYSLCHWVSLIVVASCGERGREGGMEDAMVFSTLVKRC